MPSRATCFRQRAQVNVHEYKSQKQIDDSTVFNLITSEQTTSSAATHENNKSEDLIHERRMKLSSTDISAALMILKIRRSFDNKDIDHICDFLHCLINIDAPHSMKQIKEKLQPDLNLKSFYKLYFICANCGELDSKRKTKCKQCDGNQYFEFYLCSIKEQIKKLLLTEGIFKNLNDDKQKNIELFSCTKYGEILKQIPSDAFTLIINSDGVCTSNKNVSLWPFVMILNELPLPDRRYIENVLVAGVIPTGKKPTSAVFEACLELICEQLLDLQRGHYFYVHGQDERRFIQFYLIASCTDKPAEALMANIVPFNAQYGCSKCFCKGELHRGESGTGSRKKEFTIRVYPLGNYELRTNVKCCELLDQVYGDIATTNDSLSNRNSITKNYNMKKLFDILHGHIGPCLLTKLKYFDYGISFLTDSLHTIYGGVFKKLLHLYFDTKYRRDPWSLFGSVDIIDKNLSLIKVPSTTQRRFRSLKFFTKFKGSEFRCLFHFGLTTITKFVNTDVEQNMLLSLITAINLASSDTVNKKSIETIHELLYNFVEKYQVIFGLRHMTSNVHSLLHVAETVKFIGPLWMCSTFNFEGIDKDFVSTIHGTTEFSKQLMLQHILFRDAIILHKNPKYPWSLFQFNERILRRKRAQARYVQTCDGFRLSKSISSTLYDAKDHGIRKIAEGYFNEDLTFHDGIFVGGVLLRTTLNIENRLTADNCITFRFGDDQQKYGLVRAIVKTKSNVVRLLIEELIVASGSKARAMEFQVNGNDWTVSHVFSCKKSNTFHLKNPSCFIKKNTLVLGQGADVTVLEYPNLKDGS